jgi:phthalate 4,5-cis-dihydrodiol dehydrogenase
MHEHVLRLGVIGLGRAFTVMLPTFMADSRVRLVAAADPRTEARELFQRNFGNAYDNVDALCADPSVGVVYIASPHQLHGEHVRIAAQNGKHILVEKPMAITLAECQMMIESTMAAGVHLVVGHSHSFDAPIRRLREIVDSGAVGTIRMINTMNYTDFIYRPRRPEELVTAYGGGVIYSQGAHQIDILRLIGGGRVKTVTANTGIWDLTRPAEGAYAAQLCFEDGLFAVATYSGYAHFDSDELTGWIGELGYAKDPSHYGAARRTLTSTAIGEALLKSARSFGGAAYKPPKPSSGMQHQHFGFLVVSCDRADLRPLPSGVMIYGDDTARLDPLPPPIVPRSEVIDELYDAVVYGKPPIHNGAWSMATLEVCLAMIDSARLAAPVALQHQVGIGISAGQRS